MPPFSGKKKKEQLKAKRQQKREAEELERAREKQYETALEEALKEGKSIDQFELEFQAERMNKRDRRRQENKNKRKKNKKQNSDDDNSDDDDDHYDNNRNHLAKKEFTYGEDRKGVRSTFLKESNIDVLKRKKMSYEPLKYRYFMNQNGIPFGSWFLAPGYGNMERLHPRRNDNSNSIGRQQRKENQDSTIRIESQNEDEDSSSKGVGVNFKDPFAIMSPIAATEEMAEANNNDVHCALGVATTSFPFSVQLPSRGWKIDASGNVNPTSDVSDNPLHVYSNKTVFDLQEISSEAVSSTDEEEETDKEGEGQNRDQRKNKKSVSAQNNRSDGLRQSIDEIEKKRFHEYLNYLENLPIENYLFKRGDMNPCHVVVSDILDEANTGKSNFVSCTPPPQPKFNCLSLNSYERNLEVWRQLWRAVEMSDVVYLVADSRYPILHVSLSMLFYVTKQEKRPLVIILNKSDLVPLFVLQRWIDFLRCFLKFYGLNILNAEEEEAYLHAATAAESGVKLEADAAPILIKTFTADPLGLTALTDSDKNEPNSQIDVQKRRKRNKKRKAKLYEMLRSGNISLASLQRENNENTANDTRGASFKGSKSTQNEDPELKAILEVSKSLDELLHTTKLLAQVYYRNVKRFKEEELTAAVAEAADESNEGATKEIHSTEKEDTSSSDEESSERNTSAGNSKRTTPIIAPRHKRNKREKKKSNRRKQEYNNSDHDESDSSDMSSVHLSGSHNDDENFNSSDDEVLDEREDDDEQYVHIAFVGFPNVGKSSLLNCLRGTKVVSVSSTAGHTKHIQTIPIPRDGVTLLDSPGLALPLLGVPPPLQAVVGTHQVAQVRDPISGVAYLATHLPLERLYHLKPPEGAEVPQKGAGGKEPEYPWSSYELCESFAKKKGHYVKHGKGALDVHRAAIALLQEAYEGKLILYFSPPEQNYLESQKFLNIVKDQIYLPVFCDV